VDGGCGLVWREGGDVVGRWVAASKQTNKQTSRMCEAYAKNTRKWFIVHCCGYHIGKVGS
jgi:hypothetical protein